jgi:hypothetical protein
MDGVFFSHLNAKEEGRMEKEFVRIKTAAGIMTPDDKAALNKMIAGLSAVRSAAGAMSPEGFREVSEHLWNVAEGGSIVPSWSEIEGFRAALKSLSRRDAWKRNS